MKYIAFLLILSYIPINAQEQTRADSDLFYEKLQKNLLLSEGMTELPSINKRPYRADCSGYVSFVFHWAGLDLLKLYGIAPNGVSAIWKGLTAYNFQVPDNNLQAGDIVFFHNTYDKNKNRQWDDLFTHIGVVESVDKYGTIEFMHYSSKGAERSRMNLKALDINSIKNESGEKYVFNDYLRRGKANPKNLTANLYAGAMRLKLAKKKPNTSLAKN